jgi:hypothetical protein
MEIRLAFVAILESYPETARITLLNTFVPEPWFNHRIISDPFPPKLNATSVSSRCRKLLRDMKIQ